MNTQDRRVTGTASTTDSAETWIDTTLSRREREIIYVLYELGRASAQQIRQCLTNPPSYSTVRTILRILERKRLIRHAEECLRYVYEPVTPGHIACKYALEKLVQTFFRNSPQQAIIALLNQELFRLTRSELEELSDFIQQTKLKRP